MTILLRHSLQAPQSAAVPFAAGFPPQCQPAFSTPTRVGVNHLAVVAHSPCADRHERADIVIERIHLGDFAGLESVDVWQRDLRGEIEHGARRFCC